MANVSKPNLSYTTDGSTVALRIVYNVRYTTLESHLAGLTDPGLEFIETIEVRGHDGTVVSVLHRESRRLSIPRNAHGEDLLVRTERVLRLARGVLQEDPPNDPDEISCRVILRPDNEPRADTEDSDVVAIAG